MIISGRIVPGSELTQVGLAHEIGVSTTPLREALRRLEAEGLVESRRNGRPRVPRFDPADLDALYGNRVLLEALGIAMSAPRLTADDLTEVRDHLDAMRGADDPAAWDVAHANFHLALMVGNLPPMREEMARLMARSDRYRRMSVRMDDSVGRLLGAEEHAAILDACDARQERQAALLLARHLTRSALTLVAHLEPDYDPAAVRGALQIVMRWAA